MSISIKYFNFSDPHVSCQKADYWFISPLGLHISAG